MLCGSNPVGITIHLQTLTGCVDTASLSPSLGELIMNISTTEASPSSMPIASGERILALDVMRGFALFGILLLNINGFGLQWGAYDNPAVMGGAEGINQTTWLLN
jgi:hypothetical protein